MDLEIFQYLSNDVKDLISKMIILDDKKRLSIEEILEHPWVTMEIEFKNIPLNLDFIIN